MNLTEAPPSEMPQLVARTSPGISQPTMSAWDRVFLVPTVSSQMTPRILRKKDQWESRVDEKKMVLLILAYTFKLFLLILMTYTFKWLLLILTYMFK